MKNPAKKTGRRTSVLTELEGNVLGTIGTNEPCTPYSVRREFQVSPSRYWSASAGAIYPLMRRLERRGLIRVRRTTGDGRRGQLFALTPAGRRQLERWVGTLDEPGAVSAPPDPLRSRFLFFATLDPAERRTLLDNAAKELRSDLERVREWTRRRKAEGRTFDYLVSLGAERMQEARLAWILELMRTGSA